jgi:hypothetical protein
MSTSRRQQDCRNRPALPGCGTGPSRFDSRFDAGSSCSRAGSSRTMRLDASTSAPTAPNDISKPGDATAQGSIAPTMPSAHASTVETPLWHPLSRASAATSNIHQARCAGTPNPASATYTPPPTTAASTAAC